MSDNNSFTINDAINMVKLSYIKCDDPFRIYPQTLDLFNKNLYTILSDDESTSVHIATHLTKKIIVVTFRCDFDADFLKQGADAEFIEPDFLMGNNMLFHAGFYNKYKSIFDKTINKINELREEGAQKIVLIGHSFGGCVASIFACHLSCMGIFYLPRVVTFGSPPFTNKRGVQMLQDNTYYYRIILMSDPVPFTFGHTEEYKQIDFQTFAVFKKHIEINPIVTDNTLSARIKNRLRLLFCLRNNSIWVYSTKIKKIIGTVTIN